MTDAPTTRLALADGRFLDVWYDDEPGAAARTPLVFHPGTPASGLPFSQFTDAARARGLRPIAWSRPGYGASTRQPGRRVVDVVPDTAAVLDHLGADRAYVVGHSGGGPHALACAALSPDRVIATALMGGVTPWEADGIDFLEGMGAENHAEFGAAARSEADLAAYLGPERDAILGLTGAQVAANFGDLASEVDRAAMTGDYADFLARQMQEGQRESFSGWLDDDLAFTRPWGFDVAEVRGRVHVWQGAHDRFVPFAHGEWLVAHLPDACPHLEPEHGHMSIAVAGYPAVLDSLLADT